MFLADIGAKSDWYDPASHAIYDNPQVLKLYDRVIRRFKKYLTSPIEAENIVAKKSAVYRDLGYTPSAEAFYKKGGIWMQEGVKNLRFKPAP